MKDLPNFARFYFGRAARRNTMMCVAGYEIGRSCSLETLINLSHEVVGVLTATSVTIFVSIVAAYMKS